MSENKLAIIGIIVFLCVQVVYFIYAAESLKGRTIKYDCSIAEISPDFPPQVREQCRQLKAQRGRF
jgi:hypothetical protein